MNKNRFFNVLVSNLFLFTFLFFIIEKALSQDIPQSEIDSSIISFNPELTAVLNSDTNENNAVYMLWDQNKINPYKLDLAKKSDTTILILVNDTSEYIHPFKGKVYSGFGIRGSRFHYGMDIDLNTGDSVRCVFDGKVRHSTYYGGYGNYVIVTHTNGLETMYAHLSKRLVEPDQEIKAGEVLGLGGRTGRATGSHLHFEVHFMGESMDPGKIIDFETYALKSDTLKVCCNTFDYLVDRSTQKYHYIKSGDTLWKISRQYGVSVRRLCELNNISEQTILKIGRSLRYQ
ncbi:peptidoglycan DD-metalloendopeptidase family protein [Bacteroidota bacterium]